MGVGKCELQREEFNEQVRSDTGLELHFYQHLIPVIRIAVVVVVIQYNAP